ncbi:MAG TPA: alpha/beta hydrolase-fold protein [Lacunisphaera sp.]
MNTGRIQAFLLNAMLAVTVFLFSGHATKADPRLPDGVTAAPMADRIQRYEYHSAALNKTMAFVIVYPAGYKADGKPWPVLFFLHGLGRKETTLVDDPPSRAELLAQPYVIVLPKGENGWYFDSPFDPARHFATYLDEVIDLAGKVAHISSDPAQRAIGGWSAGGFGSIWACLRHPQEFSTLATIIAVCDFPAPGVRFPINDKTFGTDPTQWSKFNPLPHAAELKGHNILLCIGDKASDAEMNARFSAALDAAGIAHETKHFPGGHSFPTVQAGLGPVLDFVRAHLTAP